MLNRKAAALISLTAPSLQQAYARSLGRYARRVLRSVPISETRDLPEQSIESSSRPISLDAAVRATPQSSVEIAVMTVVPHASLLPTPNGPLRHDATVSPDFHVVYLWSAFGLALTGLSFAMGFGAEIGQALMTAG
jgi:hypothetical protein